LDSRATITAITGPLGYLEWARDGQNREKSVMYKLRLIFSESLMTIILAFLGLVAAKAVASLKERQLAGKPNHGLVWVRGGLYTVILTLVIMGARGLGVDAAAGIHGLASEDDVGNLRLDHAYANALRAVQLRPGMFVYWRDLAVAKFLQGQFDSVLKDEPVFSALRGGDLDEETTLRFAYCHFFLGQFDQVFPLTERVIRGNRFFAAPYLLEGSTYIAQKQLARAERRYLDVLQMFPVQQAAVEGLAHVHFLMGDRGSALDVLNDTVKFPFPPDARKRFDALKAFYAQ